MILFDYGQTLVNERKFDGVKGTEVVMKYAVRNRHNCSTAEIQAAADSINVEVGRVGPATGHLHQIEIPSAMFSPYLYESLGIELTLSHNELDKVFWDASRVTA